MDNNVSAINLREGRINYSDSFFDFWKKWLIDLNNTWTKALNSYDYTDWKMFFPKAFWLNWSDQKTWKKKFLILLFGFLLYIVLLMKGASFKGVLK